MKILISVGKDLLAFFNYKTRRGRLALVVLTIGLMGLYFVTNQESPNETVAEEQVRSVSVASVSDYSDVASLQLIGSVASLDQANIIAETSGRITRVNTSLGQTVVPGQVIAQLENASQYATLLQAEGAYEAAVAAAAKSDVSVDSAKTGLTSAKNNAISTYRSAYNTLSDIIFNSVDVIYADPNNSIPGVRLDAKNNVNYLNSTRANLQTAMTSWQIGTGQINQNSNIEGEIREAISITTTAIELMDVVINIFNEDPSKYETGRFAGLQSTFTAKRGVLNSTLASLEAQLTSLSQAKDAVATAELGGTNSNISSANAQVKQALGSLRAAEANYAKTIIRTPIAGVVNSLDVKVGDYVSQTAPVATIANNNALEITTFIGESERDRINIGQSVTIEKLYSGTVTHISPAINPATKKIEIKIQTDSIDIANGDTVSIAITSDYNEPDKDLAGPILIPLTAVKFTASDGTVFTIENGKLVSNPVTIGNISGSFIEIISGIDRNTVFVTDARGLSSGQTVNVIEN